MERTEEVPAELAETNDERSVEVFTDSPATPLAKSYAPASFFWNFASALAPV
jgi:hypothetical protein